MEEGRLPDLDVLAGKVYQAKELISRLRQSNRELSSRLEEIQTRLETPGETPSEQPQKGKLTPAKPADTDAAAELERLRRERQEIRERVSQLLQHIESLEI